MGECGAYFKRSGASRIHLVEAKADLIDRLLDATKARSAPDVSAWHPNREVESFMRINADGRWFHQGCEIKRSEMVALFASLLRCEGQRHFLVTPVEKAVIEVEDTPFRVVDFELDGCGEKSRLAVRINVDEWVAVRYAGQLFMQPLPSGEGACPCVDVRDGLMARFSRAAHFRLADELTEQQGWFGIWSFGVFHRLERAGQGVA